jgi:DNA sulfur modification protein DndD
MEFNKVALHNFGVYRGLQVFDLSLGEEGRPIIVVGALNGDGKTTLLSAIQLALYGNMAPTVRAGKGSYSDYLQGKICKGTPYEEGASVQIIFSLHDDDGHRQYDVRRDWKVTKAGRLVENFSVTVNGKSADHIAKNWADHIETVLPARLVPLFFFDGERIEELANEERSHEILESAISGLLGMDLVDQLEADLGVFEKRQKRALADDTELALLDAAEEQIRKLERDIQVVKQERASIRARIDQARVKLSEAEQNYASHGGELYESRHNLESKLQICRDKLNKHSEAVAEFVSEGAPLLLVRDLLSDSAKQADIEALGEKSETVLEVLNLHDDVVLKKLIQMGVADEHIEQLQTVLSTEKLNYQNAACESRVLDLAPETVKDIHHLLSDKLAETDATADRFLSEDTELRDELEQLEKSILAIPNDDFVAPYADKVRAQKEVVSGHEFELGRTENDLSELNRRDQSARRDLRELVTKNNAIEKQTEESERYLKHTDKVLLTLSIFKKRILTEKLGELESLIVECFEKLTRKSGLIASANIDPDSFRLSLKSGDWRDMNPADLSAGERQILAVAILWALSRASRRRIPTIIDTPLGRLDSVHRKMLGSRYFPEASHQVILLSTDEEVDEAFMEILMPSINKTYLVEFNEQSGGSEVRPGYWF